MPPFLVFESNCARRGSVESRQNIKATYWKVSVVRRGREETGADSVGCPSRQQTFEDTAAIFCPPRTHRRAPSSRGTHELNKVCSGLVGVEDRQLYAETLPGLTQSVKIESRVSSKVSEWYA
jgi:hypothetical protein